MKTASSFVKVYKHASTKVQMFQRGRNCYKHEKNIFGGFFKAIAQITQYNVHQLSTNATGIAESLHAVTQQNPVLLKDEQAFFFKGKQHNSKDVVAILSCLQVQTFLEGDIKNVVFWF